MKFLTTLSAVHARPVIAINYPCLLSSCIDRILPKGDEQYAGFLHERGYSKVFKLFGFSQLQVPFRVEGDRMVLLRDELNILVAFHLPGIMESFIIAR